MEWIHAKLHSCTDSNTTQSGTVQSDHPRGDSPRQQMMELDYGRTCQTDDVIFSSQFRHQPSNCVIMSRTVEDRVCIPFIPPHLCLRHLPFVSWMSLHVTVYKMKRISCQQKSKFNSIERLVAAGHKDIEVTSLVRPSWIPQLADAEQILQHLPHAEDVRFWALIPNRKGMERALNVGVSHVATFMSAHHKPTIGKT